MKIAFVSQGMGRIDPPVARGSISIWTYGIINELRKSECVIAYEMDGRRFRKVERSYQGVRYIYAPTFLDAAMSRLNNLIDRVLRTFQFGRFNGLPPFASIRHNLGYILWVAIDLRAEKCDVIHLHQFSQYAPIVRLFNPESHIVLHMNCEWLTQLDRTVMCRRIHKADLLLGASEYIASKIENQFAEFKGSISTAYCGVDPRLFDDRTALHSDGTEKSVELLFIGRVSPEKGVHVLLRAMQIVIQHFPNVHLTIVGPIASAPIDFMVALSDDPRVRELSQFYSGEFHGESYYYECLKTLITDQLCTKIQFLGGRPYHELNEYYRNCDIFITPSLTEAGATSLIEAMAFEKPVIASRVGGINNVVVDGETGVLFEAGDERGLAEAIIAMIEDPRVRLEMGIAGRKRVLEKFSFERIAERLLADYKKMVAEL